MNIANDTNKPLDVFIILGQSNAWGGDVNGTNSAQYLADQPHTYIYKNTDLLGLGAVQTLKFGFNQIYQSNWIANYSGPEMSLGYKYYQLTGKPLLIIKHAYPGSALVDTGTAFTAGLWQIDASNADASGKPHYSDSLNKMILPALQEMRIKGFNPIVKWVYWYQGEADSQDATRSANYQTQLTRMFNAYRAAIADPFQFIVMRLNTGLDPATFPYLSTVLSAQQSVASAFGAKFINTNGYPLASDNLHITKIGQEQVGVDIATLITGGTIGNLIF